MFVASPPPNFVESIAYFARHRGVVQFEGTGHGLQDAEGGMLSLISNWSVKPLFCSRCHGSLTQKCHSHILSC